MRLTSLRLDTVALVLMTNTVAVTHAADLHVECEVREYPMRVNVGIRGRALAADNGMYSAEITSPSNIGRVKTERARKRATGSEVQFEFDSRAGNIAAGATELPLDFIVNDTIGALLFDSEGIELAAVNSVRCHHR